MSEEQRISQLSYALGFAIGTIEGILSSNRAYEESAVKVSLNKLKEMAELSLYFVEPKDKANE